MNYRSILSIARKYIPVLNRFSSKSYWDERYKTGGNSGPGSRGHLATFKAITLNKFVSDNNINSIIEFGCGDGSQLTRSEYPQYTGYDISPIALNTCSRAFQKDSSKEFFLSSQYDDRKADLTISLDVIFHLTEDTVFEDYMLHLFKAASRYVIIYSSNQDTPIEPAAIHVKHRRFSDWIEKNAPTWKMIQRISNPYPYNGDNLTTSFADFYIYGKV